MVLEAGWDRRGTAARRCGTRTPFFAREMISAIAAAPAASAPRRAVTCARSSGRKSKKARRARAAASEDGVSGNGETHGHHLPENQGVTMDVVASDEGQFPSAAKDFMDHARMVADDVSHAVDTSNAHGSHEHRKGLVIGEGTDKVILGVPSGHGPDKLRELYAPYDEDAIEADVKRFKRDWVRGANVLLASRRLDAATRPLRGARALELTLDARSALHPSPLAGVNSRDLICPLPRAYALRVCRCTNRPCSTSRLSW